MYEALKKVLGVVTTACERTGISRQTHYRWLREDSNYKNWCDQMPDIILDFAESANHKNMAEGNQAAISLFLRTKGKCRGYVERQEIITDIIMRRTATPEEVSIFEEFYDEHGNRK